MAKNLDLSGYADVAYADRILEKYPESARWFKLTQKCKEQLMVEASLAVDRAGYYEGAPESELWAFPRDGEDEIPTRVKTATVLEAFALSDGIAKKRRGWIRQGVIHTTVGGSSERYEQQSGQGGLLSEVAYNLLKPLMLRGGVQIC